MTRIILENLNLVDTSTALEQDLVSAARDGIKELWVYDKTWVGKHLVMAGGYRKGVSMGAPVEVEIKCYEDMGKYKEPGRVWVYENISQATAAEEMAREIRDRITRVLEKALGDIPDFMKP